MGFLVAIFGLVLVLNAQSPVSIGVTKGLGFTLRDARGETMFRVQIGEICLKPRPIGFVKIFGRNDIIVRDVVIEVSGQKKLLDGVLKLREYNKESLKNIRCYNIRVIDCITKSPMVLADEAWIKEGQIYLQGNCALAGDSGRHSFECAVLDVSGEELVYTIKKK
jgi:hypothetical protein